MPKPKLDIESLIQQQPTSPVAPFEKRKQYSVWFLPSIYKQIQHEAIDREMSVGEVLEEAMKARVMLIRR